MLPPKSGLVKAGDVPMLKKLAKEVASPPTRAQQKLIDSAEVIQQNAPDADDRAYLARELVQCTLPHSSPGNVQFWVRRNGNLTLSMQPGFDEKTGGSMGLPYGAIPRLLLFWINTEALKTRRRRLELGSSLNEFLRALGLNPDTGGGKRSDARRVREQTRRLFAASISFIQSGQVNQSEGERRQNMPFADDSELWWSHRQPNQSSLFPSWVELGERFYQAITASTVPVDLRILKALRRSPLALDLLVWSTHKAFSAARKGKQFVPWKALAQQFGDYANHLQFKRRAKAAFRKIQTVYPGLKLEYKDGGLYILPTSRPTIASTSRPAIPLL